MKTDRSNKDGHDENTTALPNSFHRSGWTPNNAAEREFSGTRNAVTQPLDNAWILGYSEISDISSRRSRANVELYRVTPSDGYVVETDLAIL